MKVQGMSFSHYIRRSNSQKATLFTKTQGCILVTIILGSNDKT